MSFCCLLYWRNDETIGTTYVKIVIITAIALMAMTGTTPAGVVLVFLVFIRTIIDQIRITTGMILSAIAIPDEIYKEVIKGIGSLYNADDINLPVAFITNGICIINVIIAQMSAR